MIGSHKNSATEDVKWIVPKSLATKRLVVGGSDPVIIIEIQADAKGGVSVADKVYAFRVGGKLQVAPSPVIVSDNDKIELVNLTDDDLGWTFPKEVFGTKGKKTFKTDKKNGGKPGKKTTDRTADRDEPEVFVYRVETPPPPVAGAKGKKRPKLAQMDDDFADPVIIIEG